MRRYVVLVVSVGFVLSLGLGMLQFEGSAGRARSVALAAGLGLHTDGSRIVDAAGHEVRLTGINWFGLETCNFTPHGLWTRNWRKMLDLVASLGYNVIRLPYSDQLFDASAVPNGIDFNKNPDLRGLTGLQIMDTIIAGAKERGLAVLLDRHRPDCGAQSSLWYTDKVSEAKWIADWQMLARRYRGDSAVIGADLHNEPHGEATWGSGDPRTDWRLAAERAGNAILAVNPNWLIVVEGIESYHGDGYWWGGNLEGVRDAPVQLNVPNHVVYSAHDYGPGVSGQPWFSAPNFPQNLPALWDKYWGYIAEDGIAPVLVGEFGGRSVGDDTEGRWQRALVEYLHAHNISYTYWALNPNSGDTGGLLLDDWVTVNRAKQALLSTYQWPRFVNSAVDVGAAGHPGEPPTAQGAAANLVQPAPSPSASPAPSESAKPSPAASSGPPGRTEVILQSVLQMLGSLITRLEVYLHV